MKLNLSPKNKIILYWLIGGLLLAGIIILIVVLKNKKSSVSQSNTDSNSTTCNKYTSSNYNRDLSAIRTKCYPQLLIPIVGVGKYANCVSDGKATLPIIGDCI